MERQATEGNGGTYTPWKQSPLAVVMTLARDLLAVGCPTTIVVEGAHVFIVYFHRTLSTSQSTAEGQAFLCMAWDQRECRIRLGLRIPRLGTVRMSRTIDVRLAQSVS